MKFAALILFYDCDQFILRTIENCAPHVDKIYVTYSPLPWNYNPEAREKFRNPSDPSILQQSKFLDKVELIEGDWLTEEEQRNEVLDKAKGEGFDYLIIQDADEFYHAEDYQKNLTLIRENPDFAFYKSKWYQFWKTTKHVLVCRYTYLYKQGKVVERLKKTLFGYSMVYAINLHKGNRFERCRRPFDLNDYFVVPGVCYHLSYVLSDKQVERKISTYGHTDQIDHQYWYKFKWKGWRPQSRSLHPLGRSVWMKAVPFEGSLPEAIADLPDPEQTYEEPGALARIKEFFQDQWDFVINLAKRCWAWTRAYILKKT